MRASRRSIPLSALAVAIIGTSLLGGVGSASAATDTYSVTWKAWIPQAKVVGLVAGMNAHCQSPSMTVRFNGNDHVKFDARDAGNDYKVQVTYTFRYDGTRMSDVDVRTQYGTTHAVEVNTITGKECTISKPATGNSGVRATGPSSVQMYMDSSDPFYPTAIVPAINATLDVNMVDSTKMTVRSNTRQFPSYAYRVAKNGKTVATVQTRDASCIHTEGPDGLAVFSKALATGYNNPVPLQTVDTRAQNLDYFQPCGATYDVLPLPYPAPVQTSPPGGTPQPGNKVPTAAYSYSRVDGTPGKVALNAGASSDSDGSISKFEWLYKGAVVATGKTASYAFGTADRAPSVTLRVTDDKGATGSTVKTLSLPNRAPVIGRPNPADGTIVGTNRPVLSTTVTDPDGDAVGFTYRITGYMVDKSSGPVSGGWTVPASTLDPGTKYDWTVTVTDGQGGSASAGRSLTVAMLPTAADVIATPSGKGYWQVASDGGVFTYGDAQFYGSVPGIPLHLTNIMGMARTPSGKGYWVVGSDGGVFSFGDAGFYGSLPGQQVRVNNIVDMVPTKTGRGYWLVGSDGGVFSFGDAQFFGSMGGQPLNRPVVGMAATASGNGYWLVAGDGGVFSFGDAPFYGSMGGQPLSYPVVDMDVTPDGGGYWMTAEDGGVFSFGNAQFYGSMGGKPLNGRVTGMAVTPTGRGYWLNACDGGVFTFGDAPFLGSNPTYMCRGTNQG